MSLRSILPCGLVATFVAILVACSGGASADESLDDPNGANAETGDEQDITKLSKCGGFAGLTCGSNYDCVDDPGDSCDPDTGGRDCMGRCLKHSPAKVTCANVRCGGGKHCVMDKVKCKKAPCPARPICVN